MTAAAAETMAAGSDEATPSAVTHPSRRDARRRTSAAPAAAASVPAAEKPSIVEEPIREKPGSEQPAASDEPSDSDVDAFEAASRAFRATATADVPIMRVSANDEEPAPAAEHVAPRRPRVRKFFTVGATVGVMSLASLLAVSMTLSPEAVAAAQGVPSVSAMSVVVPAEDKKGTAEDEIQAFVTSSDVQNDALVRSEDFSTVSLIDLASEQGISYSNEVFTNDPEAAIQWPFLVGVAMSSGYGMRWGRLHEGIDFVPGEGAPIQAIADGTVRIATEQGGAYGVTVYIDHVIDGQIVTSHYSHMQYGSLNVKAGQAVKVGDIVGKTGNTGRSYGAHLHFEIIIDGATIDPMPWLRENAGRYSY